MPRGNRNYLDDAISNGRRARQREVLAALYVSLGAPARAGFSIVDLDEVADLAKVSKNMAGDFVTGFDRCDVLKAQMIRLPFVRSDGHPIEVAKRQVWLHLPEDQALARLEELFDQERRTQETLTLPTSRKTKKKKAAGPVIRVVPAPEKPEEKPEERVGTLDYVEPPVALAPETSHEETRAIAGPEPKSPFAALAPLRKDEYAALIEAARQYANRKAEVEKAIANLRGMGVEINESILAKAVKFPKDERMENLCEILPYVLRLEGMVDNLTRQLVEAREKATAFAELKRDHERLRQQLQRRIAESVNSAQRG